MKERFQTLDQYGILAENNPIGSQKVSKIFRMVGQGFVGAALDTNFFATTLANNGTATQANATLTLDTSTTSAGSAILTSVQSARFNSISPNVFHGWFKLDAGLANNTRTFWAVSLTGATPNNGFAFQFSGTTFQIVTYLATAATTVTAANFNSYLWYAPGTGYHEYQIMWDNANVWFIIDKKLVHKATGINTTALLVGGLQLPIYVNNTNGAITTSVKMSMAWLGIYRIGEECTTPVYKHISGAQSVLLKNNAGIVRMVTINKWAATSTVTLYDATAATWGTEIAIIDANNAFTWGWDGGVTFTNGLYVVTSNAATDVTVCYE